MCTFSFRFKLLKTVKMRQDSDGISSLKYKLIAFEKKPLFTWILVSVNMTEIVNSEPIHQHLVRPLKQSPAKIVIYNFFISSNIWKSYTDKHFDKQTKRNNKESLYTKIKYLFKLSYLYQSQCLSSDRKDWKHLWNKIFAQKKSARWVYILQI